MNAMPSSSFEPAIIDTARAIATRGRDIGLPMIATWADISSARPATVGRNVPVAALFEFATDAREYWMQPDLALDNAIVAIIRWTAEPFYYDRGDIGGWRPLHIAPELERQKNRMTLSIRGAIVAPIHLPGSVIGAVVWATDQPRDNVRELFAKHAADLHVLALRFISACNAAMYGEPSIRSYRLTRREIQCSEARGGRLRPTRKSPSSSRSPFPPSAFTSRKREKNSASAGGYASCITRRPLGFISMRL